MLSAIDRLSKSGRLSGGFIFESFPGTLMQAKGLAGISEIGIQNVTVVHLDLSPAECWQRVQARRVCTRCGWPHVIPALGDGPAIRCAACGGPLSRRVDDEMTSYARRSARHDAELASVLSYYEERAQLCRVDARRSTADIVADLLEGR